MNEKVRVVWRTSEKLFMGGNIGLIKGYMWRIILEKILRKIHVYGEWYMKMNGIDKQHGMAGK